MVQYMYLNDVEMQLSVNDILNMWKDVPATRLLDIKLKCIFETNESDQAKSQEKTESKQVQSPVVQSPQVQSSRQESKTQVNRTAVEANSSSDFESMPTSIPTKPSQQNTNNSNNTTRLDKNDNVANELIQFKQENELLKKEINKLKVLELLYYAYLSYKIFTSFLI